MAQNKLLNIQPILLTTTLTTNLLNCNVTAVTGPVGFTMTQPYLIVRRLTVTNITATAATFTIYKGATAGNVAGTQLYAAVSVAANSSFIDPRGLRLDAADFLVGGAGTANALVLTFDPVEIGVSG
jgi:hypothetical protein